MGERTHLEKSSFGKLSLDDGATLSEDRLDWVMQQFIAAKTYAELVTEVLERARDRQATQYSKFEAAVEYQVFFTDQGVEKRREKIRLRALTQSK